MTNVRNVGRRKWARKVTLISLACLLLALVAISPSMNWPGGNFITRAQEEELCEDPCCGNPCCGDPCCGDPCCGDPCCGDPCCGDPCCGDPCCEDPGAPGCGPICYEVCEEVCGDNETCLDWDECTNTCYLWGDEVCWTECWVECY
jgi:hypothetical protein